MFHLVMCMLWVCVAARSVHAQEREHSGIESFGMQVAYGVGDRDHIRFASLLPRLSLFFPSVLDEPLSAHHWKAAWIVEPIVSYITDSTDAVEAGVNPLFVSLRYDDGQPVVPFFEGGEGVLYNDLRDERLGTQFQFSSQAGAGLDWFITHTVAVTLSYRFRHISNAHISAVNRGLNTQFVTLGFSIFPKR